MPESQVLPKMHWKRAEFALCFSASKQKLIFFFAFKVEEDKDTGTQHPNLHLLTQACGLGLILWLCRFCQSLHIR